MATRSDIQAGRAYVLLTLRQGDLIKGLKSVETRMKSLGDGLTSIGMKMMASGAAVLAPMLAATHAFTEAGDAASKMAQRTGMTAESITQLASAAEMSDSSIEEVEAAFRKYQKTLVDASDGNKAAVKTFTDMGLSVDDLMAMHPDDQFEAMADALSKIEGPTARANAAMDVFGKSGTKLLPMLEGGADGLRALKQQAIDLGVAMDGEAIQAAVEMDDAVDALKGSAVGLGRSIGSALAPMLTELAKVSTACISSFSKFIREHGDLIRSIAKGAAAVVAGGAAALVLGKMFVLASGAVGFLAPAIIALASPLGIVAGLILGGAAAWLKWSDSGRNAAGEIATTLTKIRDYFGTLFGDISDTARTTWKGIIDAVSSGDLALAGEVAMAGLQLAWQTGTNELMNMWDEFTRYFLLTWEEASFGIAETFINAMNSIATAWEGLSEFVSQTIESWRQAMGDVGTGFASAFGTVMGGAGATSAVAKADKSAMLKGLGVGMVGAGTVAGTNSDVLDKLGKTLAEDKDRSLKRIDDDYNKSIQARADALNDARAKLADLRTKTDALAAGKNAPIGGEDPAEELRKRGGSVAGSFFAAALSGLVGQGGSVQERTLKAAESQRDISKQQLEIDKQMLYELRSTRLEFTA